MDWDAYAIIDVETTGFSPAADRIVEVACVQVNGNRIVDRWSTLVNPGIPIPRHSTAIHGITDGMVAGAPRIAYAIDGLRRRCERRIAAAHCARFDLAFVGELPSEAAICTMRLARCLVPEAPNHKNQTLREFLQIDHYADDAFTAHRALDDAIVTAHILIECRRRFRRRYPPSSWKRFLQARAQTLPKASFATAS